MNSKTQQVAPVSMTITLHGPAEGMSWFITVAGVETGPFTQAEVLEQAAAGMQALAR